MLAQKFILGFISKIFVQLITMVGGVIVARVAGPTIVGIVSFGMAFVSMFTIFADLGIGSAHVKLVSEGRNLGDCIKTFTVLKTILIIIFAGLVILYLVIQRFVLGIPYESSTHFYVIIIWLLAILIAQFLYIPIATFIGLTQQAKQDMPNLIQTLTTQVLRVIIVFVSASAVALSLANLAGILIVVPLYYHLFKSYPFTKFDKELARSYIKIAKPIILLVVFGTFISYFDKVLLQYFSGSEQVGYYTAGFSIAGFIQTIGLATGPLFFPIFSQAVAKQDYDYINKTIEKFERFAYLFIMPVVIFLMLYSKPIISLLLGERFAPSALVLSLILAGAFFLVINQHYGNLLMGAGFIKESAYLNLYSLAIFIILNLIFVAPQLLNFKAVGSSLAWATNYLVMGLFFRIGVAKFIKKVKPWQNKKFWLFGVLNLLIFWGIVKLFTFESSPNFRITFPVSYFVLTYLLLYLSKLIRRDDLFVAAKIFDIRSMKNYIKGELGH